MSLGPRVAGALYRAAAAPASLRFARALRDPAAAQAAILARIVRENRDTAFGREHGFGEIRDAVSFRARVPVRDFAGLEPWIRRACDGQPDELTRAPVRFVEPSGGTSGLSKEIPYTAPLLAEFSAATLPWIADLLRSRPALRGGRAYWAVSPPARRRARTDGGIPVGMEHDSDYFPPVARALLDRTLGVPRAVSRIADLAACRRVTLRALLAMPDLAMISVWSPTFLTLLAGALDEAWEDVLASMESGRLPAALAPELRGELERALPARPDLARHLRSRFGPRASEDLGEVWPRLALISCWADGHARRALEGMTRRFPRVEVQGKGLLATEGVVSIPLFHTEAPVAAVTSHYLEFLPEGDASAAAGVHELEPGATYEVVLTTGGGLYRYRLKDRVRVEGRLERTPTLRFVGRADRASDLAGEKLTPELVEQVLARAVAETGVHPPFALLAPAWGEPPRYRLYAEAPAPHVRALARAVERILLDAHHYGLCRQLGQLGAIEPVAVTDGERAYERVCTARGQRAGSIKPPALDAGTEWAEVFAPAAGLAASEKGPG
ncbi:GH3 family domain-containing protein [Longimicrobium sp.]|uniref:GH3 family domain-containing protein n=1 Tax=Longimicrobium sp. TaxID=2029185 RepID=UPI002ED912A6